MTGVAWEPIGYSGSYYFAGNYDGGGHSITNAVSTGKVDPEGFATAGIFGWVAFGSVANLHVKNANFVATGQNNYSYVGGIAGLCYESSIKNCSVVDSSMESKRDENNNCAGSIVGYSYNGTFEKCAAENNRVTSMAYAGGFVGEQADKKNVGKSTFTNCYTANCTVTAKTDKTNGLSFAGGFVGEVTRNALAVVNCYVYGATLSTEGSLAQTVLQNTGVFAGNLWNGNPTIDAMNCYFGACGTTERAGAATEKPDEDFTNGTVAGLLGDAFAQARNYPRFKDNPADYSAVDAAIAKANALEKDNYKDFSAVEAAINTVVRDKNITEQGEVDAMAQAIENAITALQYKDADYTKVDEAIAKANALNKDAYTDFTAVETAINAVVRDKNITEQGEVDAMAQAIENAITALQYKDADYTKVDEAIAKANALNKDAYTNFTAVETAINAVVRDKNITEQDEVDAMAQAIEDAMAALVKKPTEVPTETPTAAPSTSPTEAPTADALRLHLLQARRRLRPRRLRLHLLQARRRLRPDATAAPSASPTAAPTATPTATPTAAPSARPTAAPTATPTVKPTATPSARPTAAPTATPTVKPTATPTPAPKADPNNPKTGSSNLPVVFGSAALVLSGGALAAVLIYKKKRHEK